MAHQCHNYVLDDTMLLNDAATGSTTGGIVGTVSGQPRSLDLGVQAPGFNNASNPMPAYSEFDVVLDWTGCEVGTGDEIYYISIDGSTTSNFATVYNLHKRVLGTSSDQPFDTPNVGRLVMHCDNVVIANGADENTSAAYGAVYQTMRYVRISVFVAGTVTTGLAYRAWLVPKQ